MINRHSSAAVIAAASLLSLSACAGRDGAPRTEVAPVAAETISYEVGPCFGFCPVYNAAITSHGQVTFDGLRHTATLGRKSLTLDAAAYRAFATQLASYRPAAGTTAETACTTRISDQQHYRIVWTTSDGTVTTLEHDRGCRSERNDALNAVLQGAAEHLKIDEFARQLTRPGFSRG
ncbi:DUF6438 domain-containing protein [Sphingomonas glacialis]|uniref:DUF6438 domain-containing protein n=1 Tax=Sphingomonas glacialis TaxID=658225 RepID=A0A502FR72_9SPHN|nr:DUF6438 domain-containing protein [Sphingomonas glacialis]TPG52048.1 hypothetical protein EAH76_15120 [Sphingomonas glacialis]